MVRVLLAICTPRDALLAVHASDFTLRLRSGSETNVEESPVHHVHYNSCGAALQQKLV
jgi:hypothetical protein